MKYCDPKYLDYIKIKEIITPYLKKWTGLRWEVFFDNKKSSFRYSTKKDISYAYIKINDLHKDIEKLQQSNNIEIKVSYDINQKLYPIFDGRFKKSKEKTSKIDRDCSCPKCDTAGYSIFGCLKCGHKD